MNTELQKQVEFDKQYLQNAVGYYFNSRMKELRDQTQKQCKDPDCPICIEQTCMEIFNLVSDVLQKAILKVDTKPKT